MHCRIKLCYTISRIVTLPLLITTDVIAVRILSIPKIGLTSATL